ncbi:MAG: hypothetical protein KDC84_12705 [Crocinitomicaceae bacterium]|nr:hypothetical protein [Crocinitomicaceae bacterium]
MIVQKTAKICTYGNPKAQRVWIVLHGYGQLAQFFIKKFKTLDETKNYVIAPEGLHRFYLQGTGGRVGASWMTKEERQTDIQDYVNYLNQLRLEYQLDAYAEIILVGFSQGAATSARWMEIGGFQPSIYMHWAGVFPPDLEFNPEQNAFSNSRNFYVVGNQDPYFSSEIVQSELSQFEDKGIAIEYISFEGEHTIDSQVLAQFDGN